MSKEKDKNTVKKTAVKELTTDDMLEELKKIPAQQFVAALQVLLSEEEDQPRNRRLH